MADEHDLASDLEQKDLEIKLAQAKHRAKRQQEPLKDGSYEVTDCERCGSEIGEGRLRVAIWNLWCIDCATEVERKSQLRS